MKKYPNLLKSGSMVDFISDDDSLSKYNLCHFWSNFEVGDLRFFRSEQYQTFFQYLDDAGGFFYERWGDAPVHSIAVSLFLRKEEVRYFDEIGYFHAPFTHCPVSPPGRCACTPEDSFAYDDDQYSCLFRWDEIHGRNATQMRDAFLKAAHNT